MERLSVEEAALIKKMATERLKDQLIKAGYSADEVIPGIAIVCSQRLLKKRSRVSVQREKVQML